MSDRRPRCAVIIPTYKGAALTAVCLDALLANPPERTEMTIVVVDDASPDDSVQALSAYGDAITLITQTTNTGFAGACNAGAAAAGDVDHLSFLNNDTIPLAGWLDALVEDVEADPRVAMVGSKLLFPNGQIQHAGVSIGQDRVPHHLYAGFPGEHPAANRAKELAAVTAASMLIRRTDFEAMNGFDTSFHNGYEDVDLCLRLGAAGRIIRYCPTSVVYHLESVTRWPDGVPVGTAQSELEYARRWKDKVVPDDVQHFIADGLLDIEYGPHHPLVWTVAPELAVTRVQGHDMAALESLLNERSRQVMDLMSGQVRAGVAATVASFSGHVAPPEPTVVIEDSREYQLSGATPASPLVSVLLPVKNGAPHLRRLLPALLAQQAPARLEIVAIDSGSDDESIAVLKEHGARIYAIDPADFDHGATRNQLVARAEGEFLIFLSQHSLPVDDRWLAPLLVTLQSDPTIAGVCSRVTPHADADILTKRDVERDLSASFQRRTISIEDPLVYQRMTPEERRVMLNFHTVSAALNAAVLAQIPFRPVQTLGEDLLWAREVVEAGWTLVYEPASAVYHSHTYSVPDLFARNVDDGIANEQILGRGLDSTVLEPMIRAQTLDDWRYLEEELGLRGEELRNWQLEAALRRSAQAVGQWLGLNHAELPPRTSSRFSSFHRPPQG